VESKIRRNRRKISLPCGWAWQKIEQQAQLDSGLDKKPFDGEPHKFRIQRLIFAFGNIAGIARQNEAPSIYELNGIFCCHS
jgi:hypothetical protein